MKPLVAVAMLLGWAVAVSAQVTVDLRAEQEQFVRDEPLPVRLRITNRSGQPLKLGQGKDWLRFDVSRQDGTSVGRISDFAPTGEFELASGEAGTKEFDLTPHFDLSQPGRYQVMATLRIKQWDREVVSKPLTFEIARGAKIWEQDFGVPDSGEPPEARRYALLQAMYRKRLQLYLRISDLAENVVYKLVPLGPLVSFARPEAQLDGSSRVYVLFQTGARRFIFHLINPDGSIARREIYDLANSRPRLTLDRKGKIIVAGGERVVTPQDIPPPPPTPAEELVPTIPPELFATTNAPADIKKKGDGTKTKSK